MKNITLNKVVHDKFSYLQDQIEATKQQIEVFKDNMSILGSKCEENNMVAETMAETTMKELERKYGLLMSKMEALESHVSDLNTSQYVQKVDNDATQCTESIEYTAENDEWILSEITDLNQQVSSLILPQYRMPLSLRSRSNFVVSAPFYTSDQGYRMRALAYPRNDSDKMVVCLCVLQGKHDQTLWWPLSVRFIVTPYVNNTDWKTDEIISPSDKSKNDCFINPTRNFSVIKQGRRKMFWVGGGGPYL